MSSNDVTRIYGLLATIDEDLGIPLLTFKALKTAFDAKSQSDEKRFKAFEKAVLDASKSEGSQALKKLIIKLDKAGKQANDALYSANKANEKISTLQKNDRDTIAKLNKVINDQRLENQRLRDRIYAVEKEQTTIKKGIEANKKITNDLLYEFKETNRKNKIKIDDAKKQANDALYETRANNSQNKASAEAARKLGNDALYEVRANVPRLQQAISSIELYTRSAVNELGNRYNTELAKVNSRQAINDKLVDEAIAKINSLTIPKQSEILAQVDTKLNAFENRLNSAALSNAISNAINAATKTQGSEITNNNNYQLNKLSQELDAKFNQAVKDNQAFIFKGKNPFESIDKIAAETERLNKQFDELATLQFKASQGNTDAIKEVNRRVGVDIDKFWQDIKNKELSPVEQRVANLEKDKQAVPTLDPLLNPIKSDITSLKKSLKEREEVDKKVQPLIEELSRNINGIIPTIAGIPIAIANVPRNVAPLVPTIPQIGNIVQEKVCNPSCQLPSISAGNNAANAANQAKNELGNKLDAANSAGQTAALSEILSRLGDKIPGGLSGKLIDGFKWLQIDRALNILTFAATVHNAAMLSNDIFQTLVGALTNVLTLIIPKDETGQTFNIGEAINGTVENTVKGIIGTENYTSLTAGWAKANRIYQATTNVLNSFMSLTQTVLQASEMIGAYTGKIGNALKKGGVVLENAYGWMNPQPKFDRVSQTLEGFQQAASTIQMVTQVPLDIVNSTTEFTTASTEFIKAVKEDNKPGNKAIEQPEPDELKAKEMTAKASSQPPLFDFSDLFDGED